MTSIIYTELDTFERKLETALRTAGIDIPSVMVKKVAGRIPRHVDASGTLEPLRMTRDAILFALRDNNVLVSEFRCISIADAIIAYIAVTDSNME